MDTPVVTCDYITNLDNFRTLECTRKPKWRITYLNSHVTYYCSLHIDAVVNKVKGTYPPIPPPTPQSGS